jgi:hypothetical protein
MLPGRTGFRLNWKGDKVFKDAEFLAIRTMAELIYLAGLNSRARLRPGHGYDTGTMQRRTHSAKPMYNWNEHVPASPTAPGVPHRYILPEIVRGRLWALELGCGQEYAIFYHRKHDAFLRIPFEDAMKNFKTLVINRWKLKFD